MASRRLLIVWWSVTGGTRQLAEAAADGARGALHEAGAAGEVEVESRRADQAGPEDVLAASALIVATPENLASMAGMTKDFFDRCWYPVLDRVNGRPFAAIVCAGSDGQGAIRQLERFATGWRLRTVAEPLLVITHAQTPEAILAPKTIAPAALARAAELGATLAAGLAVGLW
ncbi:flavodoxin family protein [Zeimonas arvi]|uniref:NAD(P)H-dependent oxidoreductase n=1 Tax=Zeimonas arvi TaxID=2498847 RepID=A0A5C8NZ05_9BURK|nr:NAD(P)H-dependent oxidoreductase [Zeimonas arvi]TXL66235.1 NAD(P)H-dependent oxidoreductase [Zeimonas arvi]